MKFNMTTGRNDFGVLYVAFSDFPKVSDPEAHRRAWQRVREAGYEIWGGVNSNVSLVRFWTKPTSYGERKETDVILCNSDSLAGAVSSLSNEELAELLAQAFEVAEQAERAYQQKIADAQETAGKQRGRPALPESERRGAYVGANVPADLKAWAAEQPEGISALIQKLLLEERARREK